LFNKKGKYKMKKILFAISMLVIAALACGSQTPSSSASTPDIKAMSTQIAATLMASLTQPASGSNPANTDVPPATEPPANTQGTTRDNPYPLGAPVDLGSDMTLTVVNVTRPADQAVASGNMFNPTPEAGLEYAEVAVQIKCNKASSEKCSPILTQLKAVGADGQVHDNEFMMAGVPGLLDMTTEFFGGATIKGNVLFLLPKGDDTVVLFSENILGGSTYFAIK
jgi:hypothetical protein